MFRLLVVALSVATIAIAEDKPETEQLLNKASVAIKAGRIEDGIKIATKAIESDPKSSRAHFVLGEALGADRQSKEAIKAYEKALELDKNYLIAIDRRGGERFKLGMIKESIEDFDAFLKVYPREEAAHWRRGISYYYAGKFTEGAKQFFDGREVFGDDVENAFWHWMCNCRKDGQEKATKAILKVGPDARVPMMKVYDLIQGKCKAEDVIATAENSKLTGDRLNEALFYANLYVALYFEAVGNADKCRDHLKIAVEKHKIGHYMWDVGNVHLQLVKKK